MICARGTVGASLRDAADNDAMWHAEQATGADGGDALIV